MINNNRVYVIAECGSCHDGRLEEAFKLVETAKACGADAAKFQFWSSAQRLAIRRNAPAYQEIYERYQVPFEWLPKLKEWCDLHDIDFMCSTYLPEDVWRIVPLVDTMKIASFEAHDRAFLLMHRAALAVGKQVVVSLGMGARPEAVWADLNLAVSEDQIARYGLAVKLMVCTSAYPAPISDLGLWRISRITTAAGVVGFSDHSDADNTVTGGIAVGAGARVIERHIKLTTTDPDNPDAPHAQAPDLFREYVDTIRVAEEAMGYANHDSPFWGTPTASEAAMLPYRVTGAQV